VPEHPKKIRELNLKNAAKKSFTALGMEGEEQKSMLYSLSVIQFQTTLPAIFLLFFQPLSPVFDLPEVDRVT